MLDDQLFPTRYTVFRKRRDRRRWGKVAAESYVSHFFEQCSALMADKTERTREQVLGLFAGTSPQKRLILPEEVADLAVFLAGNAGAGITGQSINVAGGAVMI